jgi:trans-aconitate methyltransferase
MLRLLAAAALLAGCNSPSANQAMLDPARARTLPVDTILARLRVAPGATVADLGAGPGYLTLPLARAVGPAGRVIATDVDRPALALLADRARAAAVANVETRRVAPDDPGLDPASVDLALLCHVDPFLPDRAAWLARLAPALRPGARLAVIGWAPGREELLAAAARAGYDLVDEAPGLLPAQFLVLLSPRR